MGARLATLKPQMAPPKEALFGCCNDVPICLKGWCCPGCVYGEVDDIMGEGGCVMGCIKFYLCTPCVSCCIAPGRRGKLRQHLDIDDGECGGDCVTWVCCGGLANCQERRELQARNVSNNDEYKAGGTQAAPAGPA